MTAFTKSKARIQKKIIPPQVKLATFKEVDELLAGTDRPLRATLLTTGPLTPWRVNNIVMPMLSQQLRSDFEETARRLHASGQIFNYGVPSSLTELARSVETEQQHMQLWAASILIENAHIVKTLLETHTSLPSMAAALLVGRTDKLFWLSQGQLKDLGRIAATEQTQYKKKKLGHAGPNPVLYNVWFALDYLYSPYAFDEELSGVYKITLDSLASAMDLPAVATEKSSQKESVSTLPLLDFFDDADVEGCSLVNNARKIHNLVGTHVLDFEQLSQRLAMLDDLLDLDEVSENAPPLPDNAKLTASPIVGRITSLRDCWNALDSIMDAENLTTVVPSSYDLRTTIRGGNAPYNMFRMYTEQLRTVVPTTVLRDYADTYGCTLNSRSQYEEAMLKLTLPLRTIAVRRAVDTRSPMWKRWREDGKTSDRRVDQWFALPNQIPALYLQDNVDAVAPPKMGALMALAAGNMFFIEVHGQQHFEPTSFGSSASPEDLMLKLARDRVIDDEKTLQGIADIRDDAGGGTYIVAHHGVLSLLENSEHFADLLLAIAREASDVLPGWIFLRRHGCKDFPGSDTGAAPGIPESIVFSSDVEAFWIQPENLSDSMQPIDSAHITI